MTSISVYGYDPETLSAHGEMHKDGTSSEEYAMGAHKLTVGSTSCPFLELPYELRLHIYSYVLPSTTHHPTHGVVWYRGIAPIWSVSHQLYNECIPLFYGSCTFHVDVRYMGVDFRHQWSQRAQQGCLYPKRIYDFPYMVAARNRPLMRRFEIHLHQVDSYMGMFKYHRSRPEALALRLKFGVATLCETLRDIPEIRELRILCDGGDAASRQMMHLVLQPFSRLNNTHDVYVQGTEQDETGYAARLQNYLQGAYMKTFLLRQRPGWSTTSTKVVKKPLCDIQRDRNSELD